MITLFHARDDSEVMFLRALLQSYEIPFFIIGENFGSLYPGVQIPSYNERRFTVPEEYFDEAKGILEEHLEMYEPAAANLTTKSKLRILFEFLFWGWYFPNGKQKDH